MLSLESNKPKFVTLIIFYNIHNKKGINIYNVKPIFRFKIQSTKFLFYS